MSAAGAGLMVIGLAVLAYLLLVVGVFDAAIALWEAMTP